MKSAARLLVAAVATAGLVASSADAQASGHMDRQVREVRQATAPFRDAHEAVKHGWSVELADVDGITCIDDPAGGMGVHYVNPDLVGDSDVDMLAPEALVYDPGRHGHLRLVAVEYVVDAKAWHHAHGKQVPRLFGRRFELVPDGNRYGLPTFYELHLWAWKRNSNGLFADWNPAVTCP